MATKTVITRVGNRTVEIQVQVPEEEEAAKKEQRIRAGLDAEPTVTKRKAPVAGNAKGKGRSRMDGAGSSKGVGSSAKASGGEAPKGEPACMVTSPSDESREGLNT